MKADMKPPTDARSTYANLVSVIGGEHLGMNYTLPGDDRPDLWEALLVKVENWLKS